MQRFGAAGDNELHHPSMGVEGGRTFGGIERGDTPAGSCADVKQPAPFFQSFSNYINPSSYLMQSRLNRGSNFGVLRIDDANDFKRRLQVEILGSAIRSFRWEPA
jgi:hypothetical protein